MQKARTRRIEEEKKDYRNKEKEIKKKVEERESKKNKKDLTRIKH